MITHIDCIPCLLRQSIEAARYVSEDPRVHEQVVRDVLRMTAELDFGRSPPHTVQVVHRRLRQLTGSKDPYRSAKSHFNRLAMEALPKLADRIGTAEDSLLAAAECAVVANAIDMGVASAITEAEVRAALAGACRKLVCGDWRRFRVAAASARDILYLADNAGEIAVDRLVIQELGLERVTVAVRGAPVLNDATIEDAWEVRMQDLVEVIDNGSDAPGTILADCSEAFRHRFDRAQLIIAKGQGNFETLCGERRGNVAFWFKVKCPIVSRQVGLPVGTHALLPPGCAQAT